MSWFIQRPLAGTLTGLLLPVALKTPPSSIGRQTISAPAAAAIFGSWVEARYEVGLPKSKKYSTRLSLSLIRSPCLDPRPQVELVGPRAFRLVVQVPVILGDRVRLEDASIGLLCIALGKVLGDEGRVDRTVDDDVGDVDAPGPDFTRHALGQCPQRMLGAREGGKARRPPQARRRSGEDDRSVAARQHRLGDLAAHQEAAERAHLPDFAID